MALNIGAAAIHPQMSFPITFLGPKRCHPHIFFKLYTFSPSSSANLISYRVAGAQSDGLGGEITDEEEPPALTDSPSSARSQLDLLKQLTSTSSCTDGYLSEGESRRPTIRDQLFQRFGDIEEVDEFTIPLGKNLKKASANFLTISQKRNIKRQAYLNNVSKRNDTNFFTTIAAFVILPPILILGMAVFIGYVKFFP